MFSRLLRTLHQGEQRFQIRVKNIFRLTKLDAKIEGLQLVCPSQRDHSSNRSNEPG